ncbi:TatD family hydrolase, partial [bacterium]|nr:TatD family hydrolase [bacterium]
MGEPPGSAAGAEPTGPPDLPARSQERQLVFTDSHLHLNRHEFAGEAAAVLARAAAAGVNRFMNVGYDPASSAASVALAERDPRVLATVGVHPHDASLLADPAGGITGDGER